METLKINVIQKTLHVVDQKKEKKINLKSLFLFFDVD
jgi:hypothetical protein